MSMKNMDKKIENLILGVIMAVVLLAIGVALGPTVISTAADINATALTYNNGTAAIPLASVIVLLATYIGTFYYLAIALGMITLIWATVKFR